jgi:DNA polymerase sigma
MKSSNIFEDVQPVLHAKVPIIRSRHRQLNIEIDISLHNMLVNIFFHLLINYNSIQAIENTKLLKTYTLIDQRVSELGYMIKHLAKVEDC